jgi:3-methyladenine DNA glycosylase AlkD
MIIVNTEIQFWLESLQETIYAHRDEATAAPMAKYMKNRFHFIGLKRPDLAILTKPYIAEIKGFADVEILYIVDKLWSLPEREFLYVAMDVLLKTASRKTWTDAWLDCCLDLVGRKTWWDTVDLLATQCIGAYVAKNPVAYRTLLTDLLEQPNWWYHRVVILHQLNYKNRTDTAFLGFTINKTKNNKEFFIQKAIGWALRQHSAYNPDYVLATVERFNIQGLAKREALRKI